MGCKIRFGPKCFKGEKAKLNIRGPGSCPLLAVWPRSGLSTCRPLLVSGTKTLDQREEGSLQLSQSLDLCFETICRAVLTEGVNKQTGSSASSSFLLLPSLPHFPTLRDVTLSHHGCAARCSCLTMKRGSLLAPN